MSTYYSTNVTDSALTFSIPAGTFLLVALLFTYERHLASLKYASVIRWVTGLFAYILSIFLVIVMAAWNAIPFPLGVVLVCLTLIAGHLHIFRRDIKAYALMTTDDTEKPTNYSKDYLASVLNGVKFRKIAFGVTMAFSLGVALVLLFATRDICFCSHPYTLTTRMSRSFMAPSCEEGKPCYMYLTITEDPSSSVIVNFHSRDTPVNSYVKYDTVSRSSYKDYRFENSAIFFTMADVFNEEPRFVHSAALTGLEPNTTYYFVTYVETKSGVVTSEEKKFKTFHTSGDSVKFVNGGDWQQNEEGNKLADLAREQNPDFISIGGDIAYSDGMNTCWKRWDSRLDAITKMGQLPNGYTAPFLMAIGNHEGGGFETPIAMATFYLRYFSFSVDDVAVESTKRATYHMHKLGNHTALGVLDSDVIARWDATQADWFENKLTSDTYVDSTHRIAIYHCPLYPGVSSYEDTIPANGRKVILPLFDKYHIDIGFEQHDHAYKRSKILNNNQVVENPADGTIYLGDGSWGLVGSVPAELAWFLEKQSATSHVWVVDINSTSITASAMNSKGEIFDTYMINK